jgi:hypothetical protein
MPNNHLPSQVKTPGTQFAMIFHSYPRPGRWKHFINAYRQTQTAQSNKKAIFPPEKPFGGNYYCWPL